MKRIILLLFWTTLILFISGCSFSGKNTAITPAGTAVQPAEPATTAPTAPETSPTSTTTAPSTAVPTLPAPDVSALPVLSNLSDGWNQLDPGGSASCAFGGKYSFFVRKAASNKLLIYFEGGGSCFDAKACRVGGVFFDESIDPSVGADNPALKSYGVFDLNDPRNPFRDYNIVFVSYCTGDAFMGGKTVTYNDDGYPYDVHHIGFLNTRAVLEWTYQNYAKPDSLFMIGCSAGVVGSFIHAPYILEHYQNIPTALIGDSGGGYLNGSTAYLKNYGTVNLFPDWLPQYQALTTGEMFETRQFFTIPALAYPNTKFGLVDTLEDAAQASLFPRFNLNLTLPQVLKANFAAIQKDAPNFSFYLGTGNHHCITMDPAYYEMTIKGVNLNNWFTAIANNQPVTDAIP